MAVAAAILTSLLPTNLSSSSSSSSSSLSLPLIFFSPKTINRHRRTPSLVVLSSKSKDGLATEHKRVLLERYGFDPAQILPESPSKSRKRKDLQGTGKGKQPPEEEPKPPRQTHKLLQVLGGKARRMKLLSPKGMEVRPMMEVVKGAAFDILQVAGGCPSSLRPGRWLDLYSGTGSVGIEAISRGCSEAHFVEMDPWVVSEVLQPNLEWTRFSDVSVIHTLRVESFLKRARHFVDGCFDYISVTPPYTAVDYGVLMDQIADSDLIGENTFIVVEYPLRTEMLESCGCLIKIADRRFGRTILAIYGPSWAQKKRKSDKSVSRQ